MRRGRLVKTPSELTSTPSPCEISPNIMGKTVKGVRKETPIRIIRKVLGFQDKNGKVLKIMIK